MRRNVNNRTKKRGHLHCIYRINFFPASLVHGYLQLRIELEWFVCLLFRRPFFYFFQPNRPLRLFQFSFFRLPGEVPSSGVLYIVFFRSLGVFLVHGIHKMIIKCGF